MADPIDEMLNRVLTPDEEVPAARPDSDSVDEMLNRVVPTEATTAARPDSRQDRPWWINQLDSLWNAATALKDLPELPAMISNLAQEADIPHMTKLIGRGISSLMKGNEKARRKNAQEFARLYPTWTALFDEKSEATGIAAGTSAVMGRGKQDWKNFKDRVANDLPSILSEYAHPSSKIAKSAGATKLAKVLEHAEPESVIPNVAIGAIRNRANWMKQHEDFFNPTETAEYGRDRKTGKDLKTTMRPRQTAEKIGLNPDSEVPTAVLSDLDKGAAIEGWNRFYEGKTIRPNTIQKRTKTAEDRFEKSEQAVLDARTQMVTDNANKLGLELGEVRNIEVAGENAINRYKETIRGDKTAIGNKLNDNESYMHEPLTTIESTDQIFTHVEELIEARSKKDSGTRDNLNNRELRQLVSEVENLIEGLKGNEAITLQLVKQLRTDFHQSINYFKTNRMIPDIGEGSTASNFYDALTKDLLALLEKEVTANPERFPENFIDSVRLAHREWAELRDLNKTEAAILLRSNETNPGNIVRTLLRPDSKINSKEIANMKLLLKEDGWEQLQPALLNELFDRAHRNGFTPKGLRIQLESIRKGNRNRLVELFGDEKAQQLIESSLFAERFGRAGTWKSGSPTAKLQAVLGLGSASPLLDDMVYAIMQHKLPDLTSPADIIGIAALTLTWGVPLAWRDWTRSEGGRRWLLDGWYKDVTVMGKTVRVDAKMFENAADWMDKHKGKLWALQYTSRTAKRTQDRKKKVQRESFIDTAFLNNPFGGRVVE